MNDAIVLEFLTRLCAAIPSYELIIASEGIETVFVSNLDDKRGWYLVLHTCCALLVKFLQLLNCCIFALKGEAVGGDDGDMEDDDAEHGDDWDDSSAPISFW